MLALLLLLNIWSWLVGVVGAVKLAAAAERGVY
jgi:hypothetical protein